MRSVGQPEQLQFELVSDAPLPGPVSAPTRAYAEARPAPPGPALLSSREAADILNVHPRTVQRLVDRGEPADVYLVVEDVAERLRCSRRTVHELTRTLSIPHRRLPGCRRCLFRADELEAWEAGASLEVVAQPRGGRIVRPTAIDCQV